MIEAHKQVCMHAIFLHAQNHIMAKLGQIREIKVSMQSGEHARHVCAHNMTQANKLAFTHAIFLHAGAHKSAKFYQNAHIKVSMKSQDYIPQVWT